MPYRAATLPNVSAFNVRAVALGDYRRKLLGGVALGLGAVAAVAVMGGAATMAAAWLLSSSLSSNSHPRPAGVVALEAADLPRPHRTLTETASLVGAPHSIYEAPETAVAELAPAAAPARAPVVAPVAIPLPTPRQAPPKRVAEQTNETPLPPARPLVAPQTSAQQTTGRPEIARAPMLPPQPPEPQVPTAPASAPAPAPAPTTASITDFLKRFAPRLAYNNPEVRPTPDSHTAVYDIEAHTVFMPNGERLEAHSGLGSRMDDPRYVNERARGATPPNVYDLTLRGESFHGVQAIRLNPVSDSKMYGRDGILAHTYMLGPSGQSFGCVSFRDYQKFLQAYLRGEVTRMVVVPHYESRPVEAHARREGDKSLAYANQ
jgi:Protein of unknown function (DUF2778)